MKKTYKTMAHSMVISVKTPCGSRSVYFKNEFIGIGNARGGRFTTDDTELQKGIESHRYYRSGFKDQIWTDDVESEDVKGQISKVKGEDAQEAEEVRPRRVRTFKAKE